MRRKANTQAHVTLIAETYYCEMTLFHCRSKMASAKETGVAAGFGVIDSPILYD